MAKLARHLVIQMHFFLCLKTVWIMIMIWISIAWPNCWTGFAPVCTSSKSWQKKFITKWFITFCVMQSKIVRFWYLKFILFCNFLTNIFAPEKRGEEKSENWRISKLPVNSSTFWINVLLTFYEGFLISHVNAEISNTAFSEDFYVVRITRKDKTLSNIRGSI